MEKKSKLFAPAKINLILKICGLRQNYHLLNMLNAKLDFADEIFIDTDVKVDSLKVLDYDTRQNIIELEDPSINLATKAIKLFSAEFGKKVNYNLEIIKRIPMGSGLAGGSSNAGSVLNYLYNKFTKHSEQDFTKLVSIAKRLGADVPFFLYPGTSLVAGIGEEVRPVANLELGFDDLLLILPPVHSDTREVFNKVKENFDYNNINAEAISLEAFTKNYITNDLAPYILELNPVLSSLYTELKKVSEAIISFSGSGSSIIVIAKDNSKISECIYNDISNICNAFPSTRFCIAKTISV